MNPNVGSIEWDASINTSQLRRDSAEADAIARKTGDTMGTGIERGENRASAAFSKFATAAKVAAVAGGVVLAGGIAAAAKASFTQVDAVQQATVALSAYEKDGGKVNNVLKQLVGFARSDMGVLFNRKDLFESAQNLRIMGDSTENLTDHVKILSRSVGLGLSNWQDLNLIVGRVGSTGRLTGEDFDNLTKAGYRLDPALRNTNITFDELFKNLDKGIPADAMAGQADTIRGRMVRLQTAFRNVGDAILGVDKESGEFIKGGLGDRLVTGITTMANSLKGLAGSIGPAIQTLIPQLIQIGQAVGTYLGPSFQALVNTVETRLIPVFMRLWNEVLVPLAPFIGFVLLTAVKGFIDTLNFLITVGTAVGTMVLNMVNWFQNLIHWVAQTASTFRSSGSSAAEAVNWIVDRVRDLLGWFGRIKNSISESLSGVTETITAPFREAFSQILRGIDKVKSAMGSIKGGAANAAQDFADPLRLLHRASGGPVSAGQPYIVGEKRPELFVPSTNGTIIPEVPTGNGGSNITVHVTMQGIMTRSKSDERDIAKSLVKRINEELEARHQRPIGGGAIV